MQNQVVKLDCLPSMKAMKKKEELPSDIIARIIRVVRVCAGAVGADIYDPEFHVNGLTFFVFFSIMAYFAFTIYTMYYKVREDWTTLLEVFCMTGSAIQGLVKLLSGIIKKRVIQSLNARIHQVYVTYEQQGEPYNIALKESCSRMWNIIKVAAVVYLVAVIGVISVPFIMKLIFGERHLMMHFLVPGVDISTTFGYYLTLVMHTGCMLLGGFGLFAGDLTVLIFLTQVVLFIDILKLKVQALNDDHVNNSVRDIIEWHQFYIQYNVDCNNLFYTIVSTQVITSAISILCAFFILLTSYWPGVYAYLLLALSALYFYCIVGTRVELSNDAFCEEIYKINWYNLSVSEQKSLCIMLCSSQMPPTIEVAGVLPLSVNTGLRITKSVYSLIMMITQFVNES